MGTSDASRRPSSTIRTATCPTHSARLRATRSSAPRIVTIAARAEALRDSLARPAFEFFRTLVLKRGFLDGKVGWSVAFLHGSSYFLRAAFLLEIQRRRPVERSGRHKEIPT